ncbi:MAG: hypothetical protein GW938_06815 [Leptospira sp.]|nr:hypothetical protein [Leptospira sp.]NCS93836.1 hypothetical protein [Leptospira sp.]
MKFHLSLLLLPIPILTSCIQFKVDDLKPDIITKIQIGNEPSHIQAELVNNVLTNVPLTIPYQSGTSYLVDTSNSLIKGFDNQGELEFILGNPDVPGNSDITHYKYKFGTIGNITIDSGQNLYIQNRIGSKSNLDSNNDQELLFKKYSGSFDTSGSSPLPSFVLKMNSKGEVSSILGATGKNTEPFRFIEYMLSPDEDEIFIYHKFAEEMRLTYFKDETVKGEIRESNLDVYKSTENTEYNIKLDKMYPIESAEYALVSLSYYSKGETRFKFRRIYKVNFNEPSKTILLKEIQDPNEILFSVRDNNEFYIWETEDKGNSVRLQVHDKDGNHINNKRLEYSPPRGQWRETFTDSEDNIYSIRIRAGYLELYRWR